MTQADTVLDDILILLGVGRAQDERERGKES
jgi:hypothetical protein